MSGEVVNINGEIFCDQTLSQAKVSVFDRGFLFGDSVYEVTGTYSGVIFKIDEHLDRLWKSSSRIGMDIPFTRNEIIFEIEKTLKALNKDSAYIRLIITRGEGEIGLDPGLGQQCNMVIITREFPENPSWWYDKGVEMIIADIQRTPKEAVDPNVKSGNYLNNVLAYSEARKQGAFDAIMLNRDGHVTEGTTSNIWIVEKDRLITPPVKAGLLEGITRQTLIGLCREENIGLSEENFGPDRLLAAQECFLTSSTKQLVPITKINKKPIGSGLPGDTTKKLLKIYRKHVDEYVKMRRISQNHV